MLIRRITDNGANDLITVYRPCTPDELVGQEINKKIIKNNLDKCTTPHTLLFTGPPGCGKTTAARIIALGLNCESIQSGSTSKPCLTCSMCRTTLNGGNMDVVEINVGKSGGKDAVDKITENLSFNPMLSRNKVLIFDEAHKLTDAAQDLLLKKIEDGFSHVYFIFCTNEPEKLKTAFLDRNSSMHFGAISIDLLRDMLINICDYEGIIHNRAILNYIAEVSKGVPRRAINNLKSVIDEGSWDLVKIKTLLENQMVDEDNPNIMEIGILIMSGKFNGVIKVLKELKTIPEEQIRIAVAGFFTNKLTWAKKFDDADKYSEILDFMTKPLLLTGKPAYHILVNNFYKACKIMRSKN